MSEKTLVKELVERKRRWAYWEVSVGLFIITLPLMTFVSMPAVVKWLAAGIRMEIPQAVATSFVIVTGLFVSMLRWNLPGSSYGARSIARTINFGLTLYCALLWVAANGGTDPKRYISLVLDPPAFANTIIPGAAILFYGWWYNRYMFLTDKERSAPQRVPVDNPDPYDHIHGAPSS